MEVKLLRHTPEPDKTVAMSARLCYSPIGAAQLEEKMSDEQAAKLVRKLVSMGHYSPMEHVTFTFAIEGVSRVLTHQLGRHRIASYSQQSHFYFFLDLTFCTMMAKDLSKISSKRSWRSCRKSQPTRASKAVAILYSWTEALLGTMDLALRPRLNITCSSSVRLSCSSCIA